MKALVAVLIAGLLSMVGGRIATAAGVLVVRGVGEENTNANRSLAPIGQPGKQAQYRSDRETPLPGSTVKGFSLRLGDAEKRGTGEYQWVLFEATKANGQVFRLWVLSAGYPAEELRDARRQIARYLLQEGTSEPVEFRNPYSGVAVLPSLVDWKYLLPRQLPVSDGGQEAAFPPETFYLGQRYRRLSLVQDSSPVVPSARLIELVPDVLIGPASNTRQKDETRRFDDSDYQLVRLNEGDYGEMVRAGMNCLKVDAAQLPLGRGLECILLGRWCSRIALSRMPLPQRLSGAGPVPG